ncbi:MAG TPA: AsmA family protein [Woeseiaceae bacterium]|nr:AsmA family protein [Woeseiaceae bacterium]
MSRAVKILGILVATAVAVAIFAAIVFVLVFDPNDYKDKISDGVREATGRELVIEGDLSLSLFPWLAIEMGRTELGNAPGFDDTPFASFDSARLSVRVLPLLTQRQVVVGTAALDSLRVNLQVRRDGKGNWEDFGEAGEAAPGTPEPQAGERTATIDVASVAVTDAALTYTDASTGDRYELTELNLSSGRIAAGGAVPLDGSLAFRLEPAGLSGRIDLGLVVAFDAGAGTVSISDLDVDGRVEGVAEVPATIRLQAPSIRLQTEAQNAEIGEIRLQLMNVDLKADVAPFSYAGDPQPSATISIAAFSPRTLMQALAIEVPPTADPDVLDKLAVDAKAKVGATAIVLSDLRLVLDDTTFTGRLSVPKSADGTFELDLAGDSIDVARYMAPASEEAAAEEAGAGTVEIPVELIRALNARGNLGIASASLGKILFENVTLGVNSANGKLRIHPIAADFFDGGYRGDVNIDASGKLPSIAVDEKIVNVSLRPMMLAMYEVDNVTGTANGTFKLGGKGADMDAIRRDLDGSLSIELIDGAWEGTDVWYELRKARSLVKGEAAPPAPATPRTPFSSLKASGKVTDGVMQNDDLFAELPFMQVTGKGTVDFVQATVDYTATGRFFEKPEFVTAASQEELDDFTKAVIPFRITGPLADPDIRPDVGEMLKDRAEEEAKKAIREKLFGEDEEPPAEGEEPQPQEEKDLEDQLKDEAKKRLKDLLGGG